MAGHQPDPRPPRAAGRGHPAAGRGHPAAGHRSPAARQWRPSGCPTRRPHAGGPAPRTRRPAMTHARSTRLARAILLPLPTSGVSPMLRRFARIPLPVRRALVLLGVIAAVAGLPGPAMAAVSQVNPASPAAVAVVAGPAHALVTATAADPAGPAGTSRPAAPGGLCQVPGVGD